MKSLQIATALACLVSTMACVGEVGDVSIPVDVDSTTNFNNSEVGMEPDPDVDTDNLVPGQTINVTLSATNVYLVDPEEEPPAEHGNDAAHFRIYLDGFEGVALAVTATATTTITIPQDTTAGEHKVKCRLHKHNGQPTNQTSEFTITVVVTSSSGG